MDRRNRKKTRSGADLRIASYEAAGINHAILADLGTRFDDDMRPDRRSIGNGGARVNRGAGMYAGLERQSLQFSKPLSRFRKVHIGIVADYASSGISITDGRTVVSCHNDGRRLCLRSLPSQLGIRQKAQMHRVCIVQRRDSADFKLRIADQLSAQTADQFTQLRAHLEPFQLYLFNARKTLSVMSMRGRMYTASWKTISYFSDSAICLITRFVLSSTGASSSLRRWFRSSLNSRCLRWKSLSRSLSSRWRRRRSDSDSTGASLSSLSDTPFKRAAISCNSLSRWENSCSILAFATLAGAASRKIRSVLTKPFFISCA